MCQAHFRFSRSPETIMLHEPHLPPKLRWPHSARALCLFTALGVLLAASPRADTPRRSPRKSPVGGWSYFAAKEGREICKLQLLKDHTFTLKSSNDESPRADLSGVWRYEEGQLEFLALDGDKYETIERGRVSKWDDGRLFNYKVIDGARPVGIPGRSYEFRRQ